MAPALASAVFIRSRRVSLPLRQLRTSIELCPYAIVVPFSAESGTIGPGHRGHGSAPPGRAAGHAGDRRGGGARGDASGRAETAIARGWVRGDRIATGVASRRTPLLLGLVRSAEPRQITREGVASGAGQQGTCPTLGTRLGSKWKARPTCCRRRPGGDAPASRANVRRRSCPA